MKRLLLIAAAGTLMTSCQPASVPEKENDLAGTWFSHDPPVSEGLKIEAYLCLGRAGEYDFIALASRESLSLTEVHWMQRTRGTWTRIDDTLKVMEAEIGSIADTNGIGKNWILNMKMYPLMRSSSMHFQIRMDTLFTYRLNGEIGIATRRAPHELINNACPGF